MKARVRMQQALTAKQRLAVSRQALQTASQQTLWRSLSLKATNVLLNLFESAAPIDQTADSVSVQNNIKASGFQ